MLLYTHNLFYVNNCYFGLTIFEKSTICSGSSFILTDFLVNFFSSTQVLPKFFILQTVSFLEINNILFSNFIGLSSELFFLIALSALFIYSMFIFEDYPNYAKPQVFGQNFGLIPIYYLVVNSLLINTYTVFFKVVSLKQNLHSIFNCMLSVDIYTTLAKIFILFGSSLVLILTLNSWFFLHYTKHISRC